MKVLLEKCVDWRLSRHVTGHEVRSARQTVKNGDLLTLAHDSFP